MGLKHKANIQNQLAFALAWKKRSSHVYCHQIKYFGASSPSGKKPMFDHKKMKSRSNLVFIKIQNTNQPRRKECRSAKLHPNNRTRPSKRLGAINTKGTIWYLKKTQNTLPVFKIICEARWPFLCGCYCPTCHLAVHHPHTVSITGCPWPVMCTERRTENISQRLHHISTCKNRKHAEKLLLQTWKGPLVIKTKRTSNRMHRSLQWKGRHRNANSEKIHTRISLLFLQCASKN